MVFDRNAQYQAYNMASQTVPKTRQIVMLYDGVIRFMQQAKEAISEKRIQDRYNLLMKASEVIVSLQACLDHDSGEQMAQILHDYYASIDLRIITIHRSNSLEMCDRIIAELKDMRNAWSHIDSTLAMSGQSTPPPSQQPIYSQATLEPPIPASSEPPSSPQTLSSGGLQVSA